MRALHPIQPRDGTCGASTFGGANNTNGDPAGAGTHSFAAHTGGIAAGLDYRLTPHTLFGFALAGGDTSWSLC
jgi:hypothetical protein